MTRAVLLDALGTLVRLEPPAPLLRAELARIGIDVTLEEAEAAIAAEIAFYLDHHLEGSDPWALDVLRDRCAEALAASLGRGSEDLGGVRVAMLAALHFSPYPDAAPALRELRARGVRLVVASNWDCSLPVALADAGLLDLVDGIATSAEAGAAKPDPAVVERALELAGTRRDATLLVGDSEVNDLGAAEAAGVRGVLVARAGPGPAGVEVIRSLEEVARLT